MKSENENGIDMGEFDPSTVFAQLVRAVLWLQDAYVAKWVPAFWQGYNNAKLNWEARRIKVPYLPPRKRLYIPVDYENETVGKAEYGPELVVAPVPVAPWDALEPPSPPDGLVTFGPPIGGGYQGYLDGGSTVEPGHETVGPDGKRYVFHTSYNPMGVTMYWLLKGT